MKVILSILTACSYVFAIYFAPSPSIKHKDRNDPDVVRHRISRIIILCALLMIIIPNLVLIQGKNHNKTYLDKIRQLGIIPGFTNSGSLTVDLFNIGYTIYFILILYSSSIYQIYIEEVELFDWKYQISSFRTALVLYPIRDYLLAPISEELIYRGLIFLINNDANESVDRKNQHVFTPFLFGVAHIHHGIQLYRQNVPTMTIVITTGFQFTYTSMFGKLSEVIYSATDQNLWSCIVLHMICNIFGLPNFSLNSPRVTHQVVFYSLIVLGIVHSLIVLLYYM
ncbi:prenyl protein peptidase [Candida albicans P57055]|nr:prenyl protein peptidase [Candida albicans P57055]